MLGVKIMLVKLSVSKEVFDTIQSAGKIDAVTNWHNAYSSDAYTILRDKSGFDNFFFSFALTPDADLDALNANIPANDYVLELDLPDDVETFSMLYYTFSDLIYYLDCAGEDELADGGYEALVQIQDNLMGNDLDITTSDLVQVNFKSIQREWIVNSTTSTN